VRDDESRNRIGKTMIQVLLVVQVLVAAALIGVVLIQRSDSDGFGLGSGSGSNFMTGRATANLLTRTTAILAALFIINSLALDVLAARGHKSSIVDTVIEQESTVPQVPVASEKQAAPAVEKAPVAKKKPAKKVVKVEETETPAEEPGASE
jgi:preprotein translocase subunit SecG